MAGYGPWGSKESDTMEQLTRSLFHRNVTQVSPIILQIFVNCHPPPPQPGFNEDLRVTFGCHVLFIAFNSGSFFCLLFSFTMY